MRLFIALNFDRDVKAGLMELQEQMRTIGAWGGFSRPENLHLTLAFLGEIEPGRIPAVKQAMLETRMLPLELCFDHAGSFRDVWWVGLSPNKSLLGLQGELSRSLRAAGFILEDRRFTPHLTLARRVEGEAKPSCLTVTPIKASVERMSLMQSSRINGRLTYIELYSR